mmetsp:Transcript_4568/g.11037  ORF Transcript_4568/g.11037 Transcript_4568/m.11037 type:complete len:535 (+) Transcript_4568:78-1682(+)
MKSKQSNKIQKETAPIAEVNRSSRHVAWRVQQKELKQAIKEKLADLKVRDSDEAVINECVQCLRSEISKLGSQWKLEKFGSVASGFGTRFSDLDATFVQVVGPDSASGEDGPTEPASVLRELERILGANPRFSAVTNICARVPILKVKFNDKLAVDLSVNNRQAIDNTKLLKAYAEIDERVRDLTLLVKHWAKSAGVCGASEGNLSSYTFTIMVIYFMQVHRDVLLPFLPPRAENLDLAVRHIQEGKMMRCQKPVLELLKLFFEFYHMTFAWGYEVVCIRFGKRMDVRSPSVNGLLAALRGIQIARIHVEDPFELERNLNCVLGDEQEKHLKWAFDEAYQKMYHNLPPVGFERKGRSANDIADAFTPDYMPSPVLSWNGEAPRDLNLSDLVGLSSAEPPSFDVTRRSRSPSATTDQSPSPVLSFVDEARASTASSRGPLQPGPIGRKMMSLAEVEAQFQAGGTHPEVTPEEPQSKMLPEAAGAVGKEWSEWVALCRQKLSSTTRLVEQRVKRLMQPTPKLQAKVERKVPEIIFQ